ncbi:MAG: ADP-ribosylglycohydrolase family protein [Nanoarchaeota archaeon]
MLLELAIGDAYGAGFEYADASVVKQFNTLGAYRQHQKYDVGNGRYTDDTQMSLAIAELLVDDVAWTPLVIARKFVEVFKRDPREGYAGKFYQFLQDVRTGEEFLERMRPDSDKSGAAMRAAPIGFLQTIPDVMSYATAQARVTHDTSLGINAAVASALMSHYFLYGLGDKNDVGRFVEQHVPGEWSPAWTGAVGAQGYMSVRAAITAVQEERTMSGILKRCIDFSGDVDTVATIALAAASCCDGIPQDLPKNLHEGLEDSRYGRTYLMALDKTLAQKFGKSAEKPPAPIA